MNKITETIIIIIAFLPLIGFNLYLLFCLIDYANTGNDHLFGEKDMKIQATIIEANKPDATGTIITSEALEEMMQKSKGAPVTYNFQHVGYVDELKRFNEGMIATGTLNLSPEQFKQLINSIEVKDENSK